MKIWALRQTRSIFEPAVNHFQGICIVCILRKKFLTSITWITKKKLLKPWLQTDESDISSVKFLLFFLFYFIVKLIVHSLSV